MGARRYLRLTPEAVWGTYDTEAADSYIIDLDTANSYTPRVRPVSVDVRTAGGRNRRVLRVQKKKALTGNLNMLLRGTQAAAIAAWCCAAPSTDALPSMTIDYAVVHEGGTTIYHRHLGMMVQQAQFTSNEQAQILRVALTLIGQKSETIDVDDFAEPAVDAYPTDACFTHQDLSGNLSISSSRTEFSDFNLTIQNILDAPFFESEYVTRIKFCGRNVDWTSKLLYKVETDRSNWLAGTAVSASAAFNNGSKTMTFNMKGKNHYSSVEEDIDDNKLFLTDLNMESFWDTTSTANDLAITVA